MTNHREQSIQLISTTQDNKFQLTSQGKALLQSLDKPIAIVSIAGMYRTGKSYLVNKLIKTKGGFRTGASTQAVTKGLSIWGRPILACDQYGNQMYYVVIDSEGIGSCEQQVKYDMKILTLVFLISSTVIYNSMGAIDEQALDQLRVVTNLKNCLASQLPTQKTKLVWVLRDFALQLVDRYGVEMTPNEYLQQCLEQVPGGGLETKKKNEIRKAIRNNLGDKKCFTLVRPTIKQDELADLSKCKLRTQFVAQIEAIREEVFSGNHSDLKKIGNHPLTGKLFTDLLQQCLSVLNSNGLPELSSIWQSVKSMAYEQFFDQLCFDMKHELAKLAIPLSKQDLRFKLNEIENKYYCRMEEYYIDGGSFKKYHRQFIKVLQKVNKEVKRSNQKSSRERVMREIKKFVKENIQISSIEPTNLTLVKTIVDRMELKVKNETEGYEYVLAVLFDLMHVSQQKSIALQHELNSYRQIVELSSVQKKNSDLTNLALKKDYHEALKTINNLKITQQENEKELALVKHQLEAERLKNGNSKQQWELKEASFLRQIQENSFKARQKGEDIGVSLKKLRQENTELICELSQLREEKLREGLNQRKQLIFEQKMSEAWNKFDKQRKQMRQQIDSLHKQVKQWTDKYDEERRYRERETEQYIKQKSKFASKERQFIQQFKDMKAMYAQTKKTHAATVNTIMDKDRILRSVQNVQMSNSRLTSCKKNEDKEDNVSKKYWENHLQRVNNQHQQQTKTLKEELSRMSRMYEQQRSKAFKQEMELQGYVEEKQKLEKQLAYASQRFADTVSQIENAKQRERSLYEESIVRLLSNLDRRDSMTSTSRRK